MCPDVAKWMCHLSEEIRSSCPLTQGTVSPQRVQWRPALGCWTREGCLHLCPGEGSSVAAFKPLFSAHSFATPVACAEGRG